MRSVRIWEHMKKYVIILAAGNGTRFSSNKGPKQFVKVLGKTILEHTLDACDCGLFDEIIVVVNKDMVKKVQGCLSRTCHSALIRVVPGGLTRTESCKKGVDAIKDSEGYVVVHNGAQPLVRRESFVNCLNGLLASGAVTAAIRCTETMINVNDDGIVCSVPDRSRLMSQIGPEAFMLSTLRRLFSFDMDMIEATSITASLLRLDLTPVRAVEGDAGNVKMTYESDLKHITERIRERHKEGEDG